MRVLSGLLALVFAATVQAAPELQPGQWTVTTRMDMPGMKMQPVTVSHCVTAAQAKAPASTMAQVNEQMKQLQCRMLDQKLGNGTFSYRMECNGQMKMQAAGDFTFSSSSYQGTLDMSAEGGMKIHSDISAKRVGECKP